LFHPETVVRMVAADGAVFVCWSNEKKVWLFCFCVRQLFVHGGETVRTLDLDLAMQYTRPCLIQHPSVLESQLRILILKNVCLLRFLSATEIYEVTYCLKIVHRKKQIVDRIYPQNVLWIDSIHNCFDCAWILSTKWWGCKKTISLIEFEFFGLVLDLRKFKR
jgi:hypothetical protein